MPGRRQPRDSGTSTPTTLLPHKASGPVGPLVPWRGDRQGVRNTGPSPRPMSLSLKKVTLEQLPSSWGPVGLDSEMAWPFLDGQGCVRHGQGGCGQPPASGTSSTTCREDGPSGSPCPAAGMLAGAGHSPAPDTAQAWVGEDRAPSRVPLSPPRCAP